MKIRISITIFCVFVTLSRSFAQGNIQAQLGNKIDIIVAKDGSGKFTSLQKAIDEVPNNSTNETLIFVKKGTYTEKIEIPSTKTNLTIIGEDVNSTIVSYNDYSGNGKTYNGMLTSKNGMAIGTSTSHSLMVAANDFTMMNMTIANSAGNKGQAVALNTTGDRQFLFHCKLTGYQDTYYTWTSGRIYLNDCFIEGAVDYIFGGGVVLFENCQINFIGSGGCITAASTAEKFKYGYIFNNCKVTGSNKAYLGRPWRPFAKTVFMNSDLGSFINSAGWSVWNENTNHQTCFYAEYKNCGSGSGTSGRVSWSNQLSSSEAGNYTKDKIFDKNVNPTPYPSNWVLSFESNTSYNIIEKNTSRFITSACYPTVPIVNDIDVFSSESKITVFPNPSTSVVNLSEETVWTLNDSFGIEMASGIGKQLDVTPYPKGIYFLKLGERTIKLLKE